MTTDAFTDRLSDYLDGELEAGEHAAVDVHLAGCAGCRDVLQELRAVMARAVVLTDQPPAQDLWNGIVARIKPAERVSPFRRFFSTRRFSFTLPQLAAAALALMVLSGGLVWIARSGDPRADFTPLSAEGSAVTPANFADTQYDRAVTDLQRALDVGRAGLDPETIRVLEQNLGAIDHAIDQCRRALASDPANLYLNEHLAEARQQKLVLLRQASALASAGS
ncbi:MAG: zf-HC2 domain-containing protein [Acidobacteriota bacterium]